MNYGSGLKSMRIQLIVQEEKRAALLQEYVPDAAPPDRARPHRTRAAN